MRAQRLQRGFNRIGGMGIVHGHQRLAGLDDLLHATGHGCERRQCLQRGRLGGVLGVIGDVEAVLGLVDVSGPFDVHVGAHDRLVADLQLFAAALVWGYAAHITPEGLTPEMTARVVSLSGGALFANVVSVIILIAANHRYAILQNELRRFGVTEFGPQALALTELDRPRVEWKALAKGYGVPSCTVHTNAELQRALANAAADAALDLGLRVFLGPAYRSGGAYADAVLAVRGGGAELGGLSTGISQHI